jgi:presenilin-like A22 family membrane protease
MGQAEAPDAANGLGARVTEAAVPPPATAMAAMGGLFVASIALAMGAAPLYAREVGPIFSDTQDVGNAFVYLGIVVAFTAVLLVIARYRLQWLIRAIILGAVMTSLLYLFGPLLGAAVRPALGAGADWGAWASAVADASTRVAAAWLAGLGVSAALVVALWKHPEWWLIDTVGVGVSAGAGALFGISFGLLPSLALLVAFAVYDAIAVYRTKHMIDLADKVMDLHLPLMLVVPKRRGYSFREDTARLKEKLAKGEEREALFMGLGDVVIPCVLVVSALRFLPSSVSAAGVPANVVVSVATLAGALAGYALLMALVAKGKAHAGLPSLNGGAILGFLAALLPLYGYAPLLPA